MNIPRSVLEVFGVQQAAFLGGRQNLHWQVQWGQERLVLRRWAGPLDEVNYERKLRFEVAALGWPVAAERSEVVEAQGFCWSLAELLSGKT